MVGLSHQKLISPGPIFDCFMFKSELNRYQYTPFFPDLNAQLYIFWGVFLFGLAIRPIRSFTKGVIAMSMPKTIAGWCTVLFFLFFGLGAFVAIPSGDLIVAVLALGAAIFTFIGK